MNLPLLFAASVLPDIDLPLPFLMHRGPTHSLIALTVLMVPFFVIYRKRVIPYFAALLSHVLIADFFTGGIELLWPLSNSWFGALNIGVKSLTNATLELTLFLFTLPIMFKLGDFKTLLKPQKKNWVLIIPLFAILGPLLAAGRGQQYALPALLVVPSLFYLGVFFYSLIVGFRADRNQDLNKKTANS